MQVILDEKLLRTAERLIRIAKTVILKSFEMLQLAFAVSEMTEKYIESTGFEMT